MWSRSPRSEQEAKRLSWLALATAVAIAPLAALADPASFDPSVAQRFVLGSPAGSAPMEGLNAQGTGQSRTPLPRSGVVGSRMRVPHGIAHSPATDEHGRIVITHALARVSEYDFQGRLIWTARIPAEPATSPVILSDGTRLVITMNAELFGYTRTGLPRFRVLLPIAEFRAPPLVIALRDGGALLSNGHDVIRLGHNASIAWRDRVSETVRALIESRDDILAVTDAGDVLRHRIVTGFSSLENFGGRTPDGAALSAPGLLSAVVDRHRVVEIDLGTLARRIRFFDSLLTLTGPTLLLPSGETRTLSREGLLLGHGANGAETLRLALDVAPGAAPAGDAQDPRPIFDASGTIAIARRGHDVSVITPDGQTKTISGSGCSDPIRPTPLAPKSLLVGCRSGQLWRID